MEDKAKGTVNEGVGKLKSAIGGATGDTELQADGEVQQGQGILEKGLGNAKELLDDAKEHIGDAANAIKKAINDHTK